MLLQSMAAGSQHDPVLLLLVRQLIERDRRDDLYRQLESERQERLRAEWDRKEQERREEQKRDHKRETEMHQIMLDERRMLLEERRLELEERRVRLAQQQAELDGLRKDRN